MSTFHFCTAKRLKNTSQVPSFHGHKISIILKYKSNLRAQSENEPTGRVSSADPVRVGDAGDGKDVCSEEETS